MSYELQKNPNWSYGRYYEILAQKIICSAETVILEHERNDYKYDFMTSDCLKYEVRANKKVLNSSIFY